MGLNSAAQTITGAHSSPEGQYLPLFNQKTHTWAEAILVSLYSRNTWQMMGLKGIHVHWERPSQDQATFPSLNI